MRTTMAKLWACPKCHRLFEKKNQMHTCATKPLKDHFTNKPEAHELFLVLLKKINNQVGEVKVISIPCCIHLYGTYDFMAILPKKDGVLELRFALDRPLKNKRVYISIPVSKTSHKNCLLIRNAKDINTELLGWLKQACNLHG